VAATRSVVESFIMDIQCGGEWQDRRVKERGEEEKEGYKRGKNDGVVKGPA